MSGRSEALNTLVAQARLPSLASFYKYRLPAITPGDFAFLLDLLRPQQPPLSLDRMVDTLSWDDEQSVLTGNLTAYRPDGKDPSGLPVTRGHLIRCRVKWVGGTYQLWTMRCKAPKYQVDTGQYSIDLQDDMALLDSGKRDWWLRKTKHRPFGYRCDEVAQIVARTLGVKVSAVAKGTTRFELKMRGATGLAVLKQAYQNERDATGRAFVIRMRNGALEITTVQRNPILYALGRQIQTALIEQKAGQDVPTTVLTGRGRIGQGKSTKLVTYTEYNRAVVRQLGYVHDTKDFGRVDSHADLKRRVQRELARRLRLADTASVTHQGIPFILRGDAAQLELPSEGYTGANSFVFCTRANHTVQAATFTSSFDFSFSDPYVSLIAQQRKAIKARAAKRRVRSRSGLKHR